jgi:hypothetical protein
MSFADERTAIESRLQAGFSTYPVKYDNTDFKPPRNSPWVSLIILNGSALNASIGTTRRVQRHSGIIQLDVYTPEASGTKDARTIADELDTLFNNVQFSSGNSGTITTYAPFLTNLGIDEGWYHTVLSVGYQRDRIA